MDCIHIAPLSKAQYIYIAPLSKALYIYIAPLSKALYIYIAPLSKALYIYIAPLSKALYIYIAPLSKASHSPIHTHIHTPTAIGCHARYQPACQEQLGVRCLAQGHFDTPRGGSNRQPSDCQTTALTPWAISPSCGDTRNQRGNLWPVLTVT